ncbi:hypothetical protein ACVWZX_001492 [Deinococcus sp. UYEF24]
MLLTPSRPDSHVKYFIVQPLNEYVSTLRSGATNRGRPTGKWRHRAPIESFKNALTHRDTVKKPSSDGESKL